MRTFATVLSALGSIAVIAASVPAPGHDLLASAGPLQTQTRRVAADLWLRQIVNDQNLDGDHTTYYVTVYSKLGPGGEEHRIVGPRPIGEWHLINNKGVGPNISDKLIHARFSGDQRYVIRITHGDGTAALPGNPSVEFALDAGNHIISLVPEAMQCPATPDRQPGIDLRDPAHTRLWITVEQPGLTQPQIATC